MEDELFAHITDGVTKKEATEIYELFVVNGVSPGCAKAKIAELFSPRGLRRNCRGSRS